MKPKIEIAPLFIFVLLIVLIIGSSHSHSFDVVTIVGEVNYSNQIVVDDQIYEVDDTQQGNQLVKHYVGQKVKVTAKLRIEGDMRILDVMKFEVFKEVL
jgi:hypothetical protein